MRFVLLIAVFWLSGCAVMPPKGASYEAGNRYYYDKVNYLNYRLIGNGEKSLFLFHGFGSSSYNWDDLLPLLDVSGYKIYLFDLKGAGFSSRPSNQDYSIVANARIVSAFIRDYKIKDYVLMGHSFGGGVSIVSALIAQVAGSSAPHALVLLSPASYKTRLPLFIRAAKSPVLSLLGSKLSRVEPIARVGVTRAFYDNSKLRSDQVKRYTYFVSQEDFPGAITQIARDIEIPELELLTQAYASLHVPALIVWGEKDRILPVELGHRLAKEIPHATLVELQECGHNVQEECPLHTANAINRFLATH